MLEEYERRWRALLGKELQFGLLASLDVGALDDPATLELIADHGDIDYPSLLVRELALRPRLWGQLLKPVPAKGFLR